MNDLKIATKEVIQTLNKVLQCTELDMYDLMELQDELYSFILYIENQKGKGKL